jgi:predicted extracellular nuclease
MQLMGATPSTAPVGVHAALTPPAAGSLRLGQMNLWNFFDTVNDPKTGDDQSTPTPEQYAIKLTKIANAIVELGTPDLISLNEIENETVLTDLLKQPQLKDKGYKFIVEKTNDERGITVGVLYNDTKLEAVGQTTVNPKMSFPDGGRGQVDRSLLYARAPLIVDFKLRGAAQAGEGAGLLTIAVNHFKSKLGGEAPEARRQMQGQFLGEWLDARRATRPGGAMIVMGDLNANHGEGAFEKLAKRADGTQRFYDAPLKLKAEDRYTYIYRGQKDLLDHVMMTSGREDAITGVQVLNVNSPKDARKSQWDPTVLPGYSDHDSMVVDLDVNKLLAAQAASRK